MSTKTKTLLGCALALALIPAAVSRAADAPEQAAMIKEKIQSLRAESADTRHQITLTLEDLSRLQALGVDLRPQFEKYKEQLVKMEECATRTKERAITMKEKGQAFFAEWEAQVNGINNADIRKSATTRLAQRKKSYTKILTAMNEAKDELVPFMSDLNDLKKLFDTELSTTTVATSKSLIKSANYHGTDVRESMVDVEKELDRVTAELATYQ
jgi:chromosome segregation ATPase